MYKKSCHLVSISSATLLTQPLTAKIYYSFSSRSYVFHVHHFYSFAGCVFSSSGVNPVSNSRNLVFK